MLAPVAPPNATAGVNMPLFGTGQPILAAAPLTPAANRLSPRDMRVLVIAADGNETDLGAVKAALDNAGIPYTVLIGTQTTLTPDLLWDGIGRGYYQGVIMTTNSLTYSPDGGATWLSAFTDAEFQTLWAYESSFGVRQVTSYTAPFGWPETLGLSAPVATIDTTTTPLNATLTTAGRAAFPYLNPAISLRIGERVGLRVDRHRAGHHHAAAGRERLSDRIGARLGRRAREPRRSRPPMPTTCATPRCWPTASSTGSPRVSSWARSASP